MVILSANVSSGFSEEAGLDTGYSKGLVTPETSIGLIKTIRCFEARPVKLCKGSRIDNIGSMHPRQDGADRRWANRLSSEV